MWYVVLLGPRSCIGKTRSLLLIFLVALCTCLGISQPLIPSGTAYVEYMNTLSVVLNILCRLSTVQRFVYGTLFKTT